MERDRERLTASVRWLSVLVGMMAGLGGCSPGSGAVLLAPHAGSVVDAETASPIVGADVFQVYWGRGVAGEPRPVRALRWTSADAAGAFRFDETLSSEPGGWMLETDPPEYGFFHAEYGLVRAGPARDGAAVIRGVRLDGARRESEWLTLCGSRPADEVVADVVQRYCVRESGRRPKE